MNHALTDAIAQRVSANFFDPARGVDDDIIRTLVSWATRAPTAFNLQNWRFIAVRTPQGKQRLRELAWNQPKVSDAAVTFIVLGLLRSAMGTAMSPPNHVLIGLALFLTFYTMSPVFDKIYTDAYKPLSEGTIQFEAAVERAANPLRTFMLHQTRENDLALFANLAKQPALEDPSQVPMRILVPAFITSELKTAFQIGFTIFIPFLIIDLVVASVLMALGMMMVPPVTVALPFKLMLFVLADGWNLLMGSLAQSFYQ